jgi:hypothetical protein
VVAEPSPGCLMTDCSSSSRWCQLKKKRSFRQLAKLRGFAFSFSRELVGRAGKTPETGSELPVFRKVSCWISQCCQWRRGGKDVERYRILIYF